MVSIVIPTYKGSSALARAIDSVRNQSYKDYEVIVVDDNFPESEERNKTEKVMKCYMADERIRYIQHEQNLNGAVARNTGIAVAQGDYIAFLDDDDYYLPDRIQKSLEYLRENKDAVGVYGGVDIINENGDLYLQVRPTCDLTVSDLLQKEMVIGTGSNIFVKSDIVRKIHGFDEKFIRRQDIEFMIRVCREGRIGYISDKLIVKSGNGTMNHPSYTKMKQVIEQFGKKYAVEIDLLGKEKSKYFAMQYRTLFGIALYENDKEEINEAVRLIKKYDKLSLKEKLLRFIYMYNIRNNIVIKWVIEKRNKLISITIKKYK